MQKLLAVTLLFILHINAYASSVIIKTSLGDITVDLFEQEAPVTVANFLNYVRDGDYEKSIIHRNVPGFVIQGGGFTSLNFGVGSIPADAAITNEFALSNTRGTIAMAQTPGNINSATSQWFINLTDNSAGLDPQFFTVFGEVIDGLDVVDAIEDLTILDLSTPGTVNSPFTTVPIRNFTPGVALNDDNLIFAEVIEPSENFVINPGIAGAWFNSATPGQGFYFDVDIANDIFAAAWFTFDVNDPPTDETDDFGSKQHRWFAANGTIDGDTATLDLLLPAGGIFNNTRPVTIDGTVGTASITFIDCFTAEITFAFNDANIGSDQLIRLTRITPAQLCENSQISPSP